MSEKIRPRATTEGLSDSPSIGKQSPSPERLRLYEFGPFQLDPSERILLRGSEIVPLAPKAFDTLHLLVRNSGHLLEKGEMIRALWPDTFVEDGSLSNTIFLLRKALGEDPVFIETVPRRGYRFVGAVLQLPPTAPTAISGALEEPTREDSSDQKPGARKILFAGMAAALLLFAAVFIFPRFRGASPAPALNPLLMAMEQRLTANPSDVPVLDAVVSPDGKYLAYADPTGLYLRQISSGETRRWSLPKGFVAWPGSWYPDGTHLLVMKVPGRPSDLGLPKPSLYKLSILGGEPQQILSDARAGVVSPDGARIAYLPVTNKGDLWIMDSDGANARKVVSGPQPKQDGISQKRQDGISQNWTYTVPDWIYNVAWSPTGQHLAYIEGHSLDAPGTVEPIRSLRIVDPDGGDATLVLDDARLGQALWWGRDDRILFSYREDPASAQDNYGVYSIRINGRTRMATGPPQPITNAEGLIGGMSGTADGKRLVIRRFKPSSQVFISAYDAATRQWKEPRRLTLDANENLAEAWTGDSKAVSFVSNRNGTWRLFRQAIDETTPDVLVEGRSISLPRLSADGTQVLYLSSSDPNVVSFPAELMSKPIAGGTPRVIIQGKGIENYQCVMAPSTLCLFSQVVGGESIIRSFDLEHGAGRELLRLPLRYVNWSLSPDGSKLAIFLDQHRIRFLTVATGATHDVTVKDWPLRNGDWGASGHTVFMQSHSPIGVPVILEVDQTGKAKVVLQSRADIHFGWMIQSPDSRFALVEEFITTENNAWIVNDF